VKPINLAQKILIACGADKFVVLLGHHKEPFYTNTKKGPGRKHRYGKDKELAA
jgi:hypothetical protein